MTGREPLASARACASPVLFLVFNRPEPTRRVFEAIRRAAPGRLYVAADGPRDGVPGERERTEAVRRIVDDIDWPCEVRTLFRERNLGCGRAVSEGIDWFFRHEAQGIILEDDCVPHPDFFPYCQALLERYADDPRVFAVNGVNFQRGRWRGDGSYYFSRYLHVWGWASWRRAWQHYDRSLAFWPAWRDSNAWREQWHDRVERRYWEQAFDAAYRGAVDTWDYQWFATVRYHQGLIATPNSNLVSNIGFGNDATHTHRTDSPVAAVVTAELGELRHPAGVAPDYEADRYSFAHAFEGRSLYFPYNLLRRARRLSRRLLAFATRIAATGRRDRTGR